MNETGCRLLPHTAFVLILFAGAIMARVADACPYGIRDAGFIVKDPQPYQLTVFVKGDSPLGMKSVEQLLNAGGEKYLADANVEANVIDVDGSPAPKDLLKWQQLDDNVKKQPLPAVLISPGERILPLRDVPEQDDAAAWGDFVKSVVVSEARTEILDNIIRRWCVIVLMQGADEKANRQALETVKRAGERIVGFDPEMNEPIEKPPPIVRIRHDSTDERILLWSLQLKDDNPEAAKVAVVFGHGRRLGPPLMKDGINDANLVNAMKLLGRNCTCTSQPRKILGPTMPRVWGRDRRTEVYQRLGFDPNSPNVVNTLAGVWTNLLDSDEERTPGEYLPEPGTGYIEFPVDEDEQTPDEQGAEAETAGVTESGRRDEFGSAIERHGLRGVIIAAAIVTVIVIAAGAFIVLKHRGNQ